MGTQQPRDRSEYEIECRFSFLHPEVDRMEAELTMAAISGEFLRAVKELERIVPEDSLLSSEYKANMIEALQVAHMWAEKAAKTIY